MSTSHAHAPWMRRWAMVKRTAFFYGALAPAFLIVAFLTLYPIITIFYDSLFRFDFIQDTREYLGIANFVRIAAESLFQRSFLNTVLFTAAASILEVGLGVILAFLFYGQFRGKPIAMTIIVFPMMISTMVISAIWQMMYHYEIGILNYLLRSGGLHPVGWLINPRMALWSVVLVDIWQWTPFAFLIVQAGLNSIPNEYFESAAIDGARYTQIVRRIALPILRPQIVLVLMLRTIDTFRLFDKVYALTGGGPANATRTVSYFIYDEGFRYFNFGRASAASVYVLLFVSILAVLYIRSMYRESGR